MSILKLANALNLVAQQSQLNDELQGYHFGLNSNSEQNIENNFNIDNVDGNEFPYLLAVYPEFEYNTANKTAKVYQTTLYFYELQWRDNAGTPDPRNTTDALKISQLERIVDNFMAALYNVGTAKQLGFAFGFDFVKARTALMQGNDRKLCIQVEITINFGNVCPTWTFDRALIPADYVLADIDTVDYETIIPT